MRDAWLTVTRIRRRIGVALPRPETDLDDLGKWIAWWLPVFHAADYLTPGDIEQVRQKGWWPPLVSRLGKGIPDVVIDAASCCWTEYWQSRRRIDDRSRMMHKLHAECLAQRPELVAEVVANAERNLHELASSLPADTPLVYDPNKAWLRILGGPIDALLASMSYDSERMDYLRSHSPFAGLGLISQEQRTKLFALFAKPTEQQLDALDEIDRLANLPRICH
ncbi:hypothetical protein N7645_15160 [Pseudomonas juntendi]|uniref:hypothetical protein n=1 Tax=Pseudomonas TaxID=286 RepID=UPI0012AE4327|nr:MULTISPECIES: hypothetical protein [Pseudomonas]MDG9918227.1 hypothetical protein [Pseudomonas juntendi]MDH0507675.1 hypothetical protein [Pseudomonas juntendi]MDH1044843.1 hypothetical protein [Pseudomonas juntendi]MRT62343.1 hypothetical protein [Pseudomonas sp. CAH-1]